MEGGGSRVGAGYSTVRVLVGERTVGMINDKIKAMVPQRPMVTDEMELIFIGISSMGRSRWRRERERRGMAGGSTFDPWSAFKQSESQPPLPKSHPTLPWGREAAFPTFATLFFMSRASRVPSDLGGSERSS